MLTVEERRNLVEIIANTPEFEGGPSSRQQLLMSSSLGQFVTSIDLAGSPRMVAGDLVVRLENFGYLPKRPAYHALGALLSSILKLQELPPDQEQFVISLIARYSLVRDSTYTDELRVKYRIDLPQGEKDSLSVDQTLLEENKIAQAIIESQLEDKAIEEKATADSPVQDIDKDMLGFDIYIHALRDFIASTDTSTPLTIGIHGPWGSGKSSLMHMVKNELDPPPTFWSWLWIKRLWLKWYLSHLKGLFPWVFGKLLIWFDDKWGSVKKFQMVHAGQIDAPENEYKFGGPQGFRKVRKAMKYDLSLVVSKGRIKSWLKIIREGLSYDPTSIDTDLDNSSRNATKPDTAANLNGQTNFTGVVQTTDETNQTGLVSTNRETYPIETFRSDDRLGPNEATDPGKIVPSTHGTNRIAATNSDEGLKSYGAHNPTEVTRVEDLSSLHDPSPASEISKSNATAKPVEILMANGASQLGTAADSRGTTKSDEASKTAKVAAERLQRWQQRAASHFPMDPLTHPTVWFNAWKFDQEEQLWAALAIEVMDQIKRKYWLLGRIIFWFRLTFKRFSFLVALWNVIKKIAFPLILAFLAWNYSFYVTQILSNTVSNHDPKVFLQNFSPIINLGGPVLWIGAFLIGLLQVVNIVKDPFQIPMKEIFDKPNYKEKVGFLGSFEEDFKRIVSVVTRPRLGWNSQKLVIFIDDLDRCEPPKAADIIEGINLFLDSPGCIFVLGMDPIAVAASIETKYKDLFEKMRRENPGVISPGRLFLDKIIQVPFQVPPSTGEGIARLISEITESKVQMVVSPAGQVNQENSQSQTSTQNKVGPASYKLTHIQEAIRMGAKFLPENPRQVKKFVNLFRFYVYIADARGLLRYREEGPEKQKVGLTLERLAIWVAWSIRWAEIAKPLSDEVQLTNLREYLLKISKLLDGDGHWVSMEDAVKICPGFGNLTLFPVERSENGHDPVYDSLIKDIHKLREVEKDSTSHWCYLPWEWWLLDAYFRRGIWEMKSFWQKPPEGGYDWLRSVITWSRDKPSTRGGTIENQLSST